MADIIGVIQVKGGVGRSTIATNLAAILSAAGPTTLIDCDLPQGTAHPGSPQGIPPLQVETWTSSWPETTWSWWRRLVS